jgi:hypothetical protein
MSKTSIPLFKNNQERENFWLSMCQNFNSSGLSKVSFCKIKGISEAALYRWMRYYKNKLTTKAKSNQNIGAVAAKNPFFVPIKSADDYSNLSSSGVQILLPNGLKLIINQPLSVILLSELMKAGV